ncbi:1,4-dihydroxy-2-naphthoate octaprenyltransferase [bioreactor metagenome]|uniref:1,4-dihydroxy-2-naphthoate octaprenyltransferase n=1 Tax=bioreactor metagenome TaxID=1076179 RepID=A0A644WKE4_9ZZZZ
MAYFRLFRVVNLLIMALIMYFVRFFLFDSALAFENIVSPLTELQFAMLVGMFVLFGAGGYSLNDYFDIGMDEINNPGKTVLRDKLPLSAGLNWFFILTAAGLVVGFILAFMLKSTTLYFMPVFLAAMYWFYSTKYKREFLSGNLVVSLMAAFNVGIIYIYYIMAFVKVGTIPVIMMPYINTTVIIFTSFAFYITFIREVVKDIPDMEGDKEFECNNLPIKLGVKNTKIILLSLSVVFLAALTYFAFYSFQLSKSYLMYFIVILLIPYWIFIMRSLWIAKEKKDFKDLATMLKIYMIAGIFSLQLLHMSNQWR